jgi:hypothetical protein
MDPFFFFRVRKKERNLSFSCFSLSRFYGAFHSMGGRWWGCGHSPKTCSRKSHDFSRRIPTGTIASTKKFFSFTCSSPLPYMFNNNNIYHVPLGLSDGMPHNSNIPPASTIQCFYIPKKPVRYINDSQKYFLFNHQDQYGPSPFAISHTVWSTNVTGKMHLEGESAQQPPSSTIWKN